MPNDLPPALQPTPLPKLLRFWAIRVGIMTVLVILWQTYGDPVGWLWLALAGYAAFSLAMTLLLERYKAKKAQQVAEAMKQIDDWEPKE